MAPRTLLRFLATMGPSQTLSSSTDFLGAPVIRLVLLRRFRDGTRRASPVALRVLAIVRSLLTPPEWIAASVRCDHPCCLRRTVGGSASGATHFRGHLCVHFGYGPMAHCHPKEDLVDRLQRFSFLPPCYPSYEASDFCPGGTLFPLNTPAFAGRTTARAVFPHAALAKTQRGRNAREGIKSISRTSLYSPYSVGAGSRFQPALRQCL